MNGVVRIYNFFYSSILNFDWHGNSVFLFIWNTFALIVTISKQSIN